MADEKQSANIIEAIRKRMGIPNYIPTYREAYDAAMVGWYRATFAERERCLRHAESFIGDGDRAPGLIAAAIRSGK